MFIVENVGQTEAFFKKGHFTSTGISSVKKYPERSHMLETLERSWNPWKLSWMGFTKLKISYHDSTFPFLVLCLIT